MNSFRKKLQTFVDSAITQSVIIWLIILNALIMGLETFAWYKNLLGSATEIIDQFFVWIFLLEVVLKILAHGFHFFKSGWNNFDFFIVVISLILALPVRGALGMYKKKNNEAQEGGAV